MSAARQLLGAVRRHGGGPKFRRSFSGSSSGLRDVVIVAAKRTPFGGFHGGLASLSAVQLGSVAIKAAVEEANVKPEQVQELFMGNVLSSGLGQAPARQAALEAGLSLHCVCTTVNKVCASGMKAVMLGAQSIAMGVNDLVVAGGMESMSNAPYLMSRARAPKHTGELKLQDSMMRDGLWDPIKNVSMGDIAESCAAEMNISREDQDQHAIRSYERATAAQATGILSHEIVPLTISGQKGKENVVSQDEECSKFDPEKLQSLHPAFKGDGTVTAGNSSTISDGAAVLVLSSAAFAEKEGLKILARVRGFGDAEQAPEKFPTSPALAIPRALNHAGLQLKDVDLFEINEAFSVVDIANQQLLGLSPDQVNVYGGAVSLGHPIGASGARIIMSLITGLAFKNLKVGVAAVCNGGGGASAIVVERDDSHVLHEHGRARLEVKDEA
ncbi:acetyl-CoA C-acetyltransferase [Marchantia polymorpha subsp. ruderalis]|uniref:acetyl-CoA C-acetyltransferase n=3 Tax=Marchantia polymorpha TaxID=3197 RepID=A0AAF6BIE1_MARPO|nr:hypothetical protein MARPO_0032s0155 [Marchantia polymorpha]BBN11775.1 hypothetical protein Mp_5g14630 [Marchantia polymorpha subsp. ruderalis]|eukprot:PTQ41993.1 hypothetical protein MARPO_0032s0155 [Marchantia polymorpha]